MFERKYKPVDEAMEKARDAAETRKNALRCGALSVLFVITDVVNIVQMIRLHESARAISVVFYALCLACSVWGTIRLTQKYLKSKEN